MRPGQGALCNHGYVMEQEDALAAEWQGKWDEY